MKKVINHKNLIKFCEEKKSDFNNYFYKNSKNEYLKNISIIDKTEEEIKKDTNGNGLAYTNGYNIFLPRIISEDNIISRKSLEKREMSLIIRNGYEIHELAHYEEDKPSVFLLRNKEKLFQKYLINLTKKDLEDNKKIQKIIMNIKEEIHELFEKKYGKTLNKEEYNKYIGVMTYKDLNQLSFVHGWYNALVDIYIENQQHHFASNKEESNYIKEILFLNRDNMHKMSEKYFNDFIQSKEKKEGRKLTKEEIDKIKNNEKLNSKLMNKSMNFIDPRFRKKSEKMREFDDKDWKIFYNAQKENLDKLYLINKKLNNLEYGNYNSLYKKKENIYSKHFVQIAVEISDFLLNNEEYQKRKQDNQQEQNGQSGNQDNQQEQNGQSENQDNQQEQNNQEKELQNKIAEELSKESNKEKIENLQKDQTQESQKEALKESLEKLKEEIEKENESHLGKKFPNSKKSGKSGKYDSLPINFKKIAYYETPAKYDKENLFSKENLEYQKSKIENVIKEFNKKKKENKELKKLLLKSKNLMLKTKKTLELNSKIGGSSNKMVDKYLKGTTKVYTKYKTNTMGNLSIFILYDNSGSMSATMNDGYTRKRSSMFFIYMLNEMFSKLNVNFDIRGFDPYNSYNNQQLKEMDRKYLINWEIIKKFDENLKSNKLNERIAAAELNGTGGGTNLLSSFIETYRNIKKYQTKQLEEKNTKEPVILITISDGDSQIEDQKQMDYSVQIENQIENDPSIIHLKLNIDEKGLMKYFGFKIKGKKYFLEEKGYNQNTIIEYINGQKKIVANNIEIKEGNKIYFDGIYKGKSEDFACIKDANDFSLFMNHNIQNILSIISESSESKISSSREVFI